MANFSVAASLDDVMSIGVYFYKTDNKCVCGSSGGDIYDSAMRFLNMNIPQGSTILTAFITLVCAQDWSGVTMLTNLALEDADNATQIADEADFNGRSLTAVVAWDSIPAWSAGTSYVTPSLVTPFQTVISRVGWSANNAVNVFWKDDGSTSGAVRHGASWDNVTYTEPVLTITWTPPVTTRRIFVVS